MNEDTLQGKPILMMPLKVTPLRVHTIRCAYAPHQYAEVREKPGGLEVKPS